MATLDSDVYNAIDNAFDLTAEQVSELVSVFQDSPTLINMLNTFISSGGKLEYDSTSKGTYASGSLSTEDAVITLGKDFQLGSVIDQKSAFADATLLAHELGHAVTPGGKGDWSGVTNS